MIAYNCIVTANDVYLNNNNIKLYIMKNSKDRDIKTLCFFVIRRESLKTQPDELLAVRLNTHGERVYATQLQLAHTHAVYGRRVQDATTEQIREFLTTEIERERVAGPEVQILKCVIEYIRTL